MKTLIKKTLVLLLVVISASACAQSGGFGFRRVQTKAELDAIAVNNANTSHSRRGYVHATGLYYIWNGTVWVEEQEIAKILGSIPPAYSPTTEQAYTAINDDGDLFVWNGTEWLLKGNGIYGGSGRVPDSTIATIDDGITFQSDTVTGEFTIDMDQGLYGSYFKQTPDTVYAEYYDLSGTNIVAVNGDGVLLKAETPDKVFVDGVLQLQDLTTALLTDSASFIVGADSTGNTSRVKLGSNLSLDGDTLNAVSGITNFGSGDNGQIAFWLNDTLRGVDTIRLNQIERASETTPSYIENGAVPIANSSGTLVYSNVANFPADFPNGTHVGVRNPNKTRGLAYLDQFGGLRFGAAQAGTGSWTLPSTRTEVGIDPSRSALSVFYYATNSGSGTNAPAINFLRTKTNNSSTVLPPLQGDRLMLLRGASHRGLVDTLVNPMDYSNSYTILTANVDTVYSTGELATRLGLWARSAALHGNNNIPDGRMMLELRGQAGDIRLPLHTSSRNDATPIVNILYTNNLGDLRSSPIADLIALLPGGGADLTIEGSGPTYSIASSSGTDVGIAGVGITLSESPANTLVFTAADASATNEIQNLGYTAATGALTISSGTGTTIPVMTATTRGLVPDGDGAGTDEFLREDGTWAVPPGGAGTDLDFTGAGVSIGLTSSTGNDVTFNAGTNISFTRVGPTLTIDATGGAPAGANYQLQYYNTGNFGAEAELNYNPTNNQLVVGHTTPGATIHGRYHAYNGGSVFRFETKSGSDILNLFENGYLKFGNGETYPRFYQSATTGGAVDSLSAGIVTDVSIASATANEDMFGVNSPPISPTSGTKTGFKVKSTFEPTSGTSVWNSIEVTPTINQTGGANGKTRGIYINPTLTAAADFTSLEVVGEVKTNQLQGRGSAPSITVNTTTCGAGATASVIGTDLGFEVTVNFGTGASAAGGEMFQINYALTQPGPTIPVFSPGDDAGIFASLERTLGAYVANPDNTDFQLWTNGNLTTFESTSIKINFFISSR